MRHLLALLVVVCALTTLAEGFVRGVQDQIEPESFRSSPHDATAYAR